MESQNTVFWWVQQLTDELVSKKIRSYTQIKQDNFKTTIEKFYKRIKIVKNEFLLVLEDKQAQATKLFEAVKLQKATVFEFDNESIPKIDFGVLVASVVPQIRSIARIHQLENKNEQILGYKKTLLNK